MRKILLPCAIATSLLLSPQLSARHIGDFDFNYDQPDYSEYSDDFDFNYDQPNQKERLVQHLNEDIYDHKIYKIKKMFKLGSHAHKGQKLVKLVVHADAYSSRAKARLVINKVPSSQVVHMDQYKTKFVFKLPAHQSSLDGDLRSLQLELRGDLHIRKMVAVLKNSNRIQKVSEDMWETFQGQNLVPVKRILKLRQHQGKKLAYVEVEGDSARGRGQVQLMIDGYLVGGPQVLAKFGSTLKFKVPNHIPALGNGIGRVQLKLKGNIYIESLSAGLKTKNGGGHQEPPRGRSHSEIVDMDLSGNQTVFLADVLDQLSPRLMNKPLKSIKVTVSSKRNRGKAKLCISGDCLEAHSLANGPKVISEQIFSEGLSELSLQTRGKVTIEKVELKFQ